VFTWDAGRASRNLSKHGVSSEEAATVFADADALKWEDLEHSHQESLFKRLGISSRGRILILVYSYRRRKHDKETLRISAARVRKNAKHMQDDRIDFSELPQSTDEELRRARRVGRPKSENAKQLIAIRISPRLLAQLRRLAAKRDKPYQTLIHELLEQAARKSRVA
jgi:uncharacterized DUF497 family protein